MIVVSSIYDCGSLHLFLFDGEQVKELAKNLVRDLTGLTDAVKQAEKDKRVNEKELDNARAVLKKLQQVQI